MTTPQWTDTGSAVNLEAVAWDALLWLNLFQKLLAENPRLLPTKQAENAARLHSCIVSLEKILEVSA